MEILAAALVGFAVDLLLTAAFLALLPLSRREVRGI